MSDSWEAAVAVYFARVQPRDFPDLMQNIRHDLSVLVGSFASYLSLIEHQIPNLDLSDEERADLAQLIRLAPTIIQRLHQRLNDFPDFAKTLASDTEIAFKCRDMTIFKLKECTSALSNLSAVVQMIFEWNPSSSPTNQRMYQFNQAMLSTAERMTFIVDTCREYSLA